MWLRCEKLLRNCSHFKFIGEVKVHAPATPYLYFTVAHALLSWISGWAFTHVLMKSASSFKFELAYFVATEQLAFAKYPNFCELEEQHGVSIGVAYRNEIACKEFLHYTAESSR